MRLDPRIRRVRAQTHAPREIDRGALTQKQILLTPSGKVVCMKGNTERVPSAAPRALGLGAR
jgi:hypothetical protein